MNKYFPEIKKNFGFGCMRLPMIGEDIDQQALCAMIDQFIAAGFNYFDTARPYHKGFSEKMLKLCLAQRHDRSAFLLANKLSPNFFEKEEDVPRFAITMGIGAIMQAKRVLLVVNGEKKAQAVKDCFFGPIKPQAPGSILQLHPDFILVADEAALSLVKDQL